MKGQEKNNTETKMLSELNPGDIFKREDGLQFEYQGEVTDYGKKYFGVKVLGFDTVLWAREDMLIYPCK